ncbi:aspartate/glutamate racemase family protein [Paeniroseomonas aquatica]|uniref:Aspartate/glutamate racemase family protein n=2 Tax=Paeniroseomonas aquatica TaxID=373043 RepID=A0ABT8ADZ9_9PROT|nr:aspartate/glutamate racemase family protein [Paeniroseomonas aquatica]MDN3567987.1 aspartate/glutamate racemase family protein [Paeniroseomonas aquatica]
MRIWYQSMTRAEAWPAYAAALQRTLAAAADPGTRIEIHGITRRGGIGDQYRSLEFIETIEVLENVARAEAEGFDAVLLGNIADPGLRPAREMVSIPVLGLCETALLTACQMGASIGLVVANDKHQSRVVENVTLAGLGGRVVAVERMQVDRLVDLDAAFAGGAARDRVIGQFMAAAEACVARGAEVVIPAAGVAMILLAEAGIQDAGGGAPVLNASVALLKAGEMAVKLNRLMGGRFTSRRRTYAQPPPGQIAELRAAYGDIFPRIVPS